MVFTQHVAAGTDYYFSVQTTEGGDGEAAYGVSQGYTITAEPVARRLYGPSRVI